MANTVIIQNGAVHSSVTYYTVRDIAVEGTRLTLTMIDGAARYALAKLSAKV